MRCGDIIKLKKFVDYCDDSIGIIGLFKQINTFLIRQKLKLFRWIMSNQNSRNRYLGSTDLLDHIQTSTYTA